MEHDRQGSGRRWRPTDEWAPGRAGQQRERIGVEAREDLLQGPADQAPPTSLSLTPSSRPQGYCHLHVSRFLTSRPLPRLFTLPGMPSPGKLQASSDNTSSQKHLPPTHTIMGASYSKSKSTKLQGSPDHSEVVPSQQLSKSLIILSFVFV